MKRTAEQAEIRAGLFSGFAAFATWGLSPLYWKWLGYVPAPEIVAHRTVWSALFMVVVLAVVGKLGGIRAQLATPGLLPRLLLSALLIGSNWLLYIHAVVSGQLLEASLGYFTNPLVSVVLGVVFLGEKLTPRRRFALVLAGLAVVVLAVRVGSVPWIALALAASFGFYGLIRKTIPIAGAEGLAVETTLLAPLCLGFLVLGPGSEGAFRLDQPVAMALLVGGGVVTALPLWWFANAARRLPLSTVGMLQYLSPTLQFLLAVLLYREPFDRVRLIAFILVWVACAVFSWPARTRTQEASP